MPLGTLINYLRYGHPEREASFPHPLAPFPRRAGRFPEGRGGSENRPYCPAGEGGLQGEGLSPLMDEGRIVQERVSEMKS